MGWLPFPIGRGIAASHRLPQTRLPIRALGAKGKVMRSTMAIRHQHPDHRRRRDDGDTAVAKEKRPIECRARTNVVVDTHRHMPI